MGKKAKLKAIKRLAANVPLINEATNEKHFYKGSEILEWGTITEIDGKPIDPSKIYQYNYPVLMIQNKQRRLKRAYLKHGIEGVKHFHNKTVETIKSNIS